MKLIEELRAEHDLIERVLGSLRTFVERLVRGEIPDSDGPRFMTFFRVYAGAFHHEREEEILIPALLNDASLPGNRGPIAVILSDHRNMAELLGAIAEILEDEVRAQDAFPGERLRDLAVRYSHALWAHIDAENSVLLPESEERLRQHGIHELPCRELSDMERSAAETGEELIRLYPPYDDPDVIRGDGCAMCPSYGDSCGGVEREWWNEWEWEEFDEHIGAS